MPSPRGASAIGVTATMATLAPSAPTPPTRGSIWNGGIRGYPIIIRGLVMTRKCPSQGRVRGKTRSRTAPGQPMSNRGVPRHVVFSGRLQSNPGLEWLGRGGEGRAYLQGRKPLLELPKSSHCKMLFTGFLPPDCARYFWPVPLQFAGFLVSYLVVPKMCAGLGELL